MIETFFMASCLGLDNKIIIKTLNYPGSSPDFSFIENCWQVLKQKSSKVKSTPSYGDLIWTFK